MTLYLIDTLPISTTFMLKVANFLRFCLVAVVVATCLVLSTSTEAENACSRNSSSLACQAYEATESGPFCAGCMPIGDLMKIELRWDKIGHDLDLHVWRPAAPTETSRPRVGWDNAEEGPTAWYSCDYQGGGRGRSGCITKGERVNIARSAFLYTENEDRTYCVAVQNFSRAEPGNYTLSLAPVGAAALTCTGTEPVATGPLNADERAALDRDPIAADICGGTFPADVGLKIATLPWLSLLVFRAPVPSQSVSLDDLVVVRGLNCIDNGTGKPVTVGDSDAD